MDIIRGSLSPKPVAVVNELKRQLSKLGYEFSEGIAELQFTKPGQLEAVVIELTPIVEKAGWNVWSDLKLVQESTDKPTTAIYQDGRVIRKFPRGV